MTFPAPTASVTAPPTIALPVPRCHRRRTRSPGEGPVLQTADRPPQLCLGPVARVLAARSAPACPLVGWAWDERAAAGRDGLRRGGSRSGTYAVTGRFDGRALTVTGSVPLALYDVAAHPSPRPSAPPDLDAAQWDAVDGGLAVTPGLIMRGREGDRPGARHRGATTTARSRPGPTTSFGAGVVVVTSALR